MANVTVTVRISAEEYLRWYQGSAHTVLAYTDEGKKVRFPANILQRFVQRDGINGRFCIAFDTDGKFQSVEKID